MFRLDGPEPSAFGSEPLSHRKIEGGMAADLGLPPAVSGVVPSDSSFPPTVTGVVPTESCFPPPTSAVSAEPSVLLTPQPLAEHSSGVEQGAVGIRPLVPTPGLQALNMSVFTDVELMDGHDETKYTDCFPPALNPAAAQALEDIDKHTLLTGSIGTAASVLAPRNRPFTVGKPEKVFDINHFHVSSGHQHERLLRQTAQQHGITLTGVLQPCGGCLEAKGIRSGTPRRTRRAQEGPWRPSISICSTLTRRPWAGRCI